jgi:hypothetical protein
MTSEDVATRPHKNALDMPGTMAWFRGVIKEGGFGPVAHAVVGDPRD